MIGGKNVAPDESPKTDVLSPTLGARPAITEEKERSRAGVLRSTKSEMNISSMSRTLNTPSSFDQQHKRRSAFEPHRASPQTPQQFSGTLDMKTSTPKFTVMDGNVSGGWSQERRQRGPGEQDANDSFKKSPNGPPPYHHTPMSRSMSIDRDQLDSRVRANSTMPTEPPHHKYNAQNIPPHNTTTSLSGYGAAPRTLDYNEPPREVDRGDRRSSSHVDHGEQRGSLQHSTSSGSSGGGIGSYNVTTGQSNIGMPPRPKTPSNTYTDSKQHLPRQPSSSSAQSFGSDRSDPYAQNSAVGAPRYSNPAGQSSQTTPPQPQYSSSSRPQSAGGRDKPAVNGGGGGGGTHGTGDTSYNPGNVRNLVQSFQNTVKSPAAGGEVTSNSGGVARRQPRPQSAGPLRSSSNSAFSVPPQRPRTPGGTDRAFTPIERVSGPADRNSTGGGRQTGQTGQDRPTGRTLPQTPIILGGVTPGRTLPARPESRQQPATPNTPTPGTPTTQQKDSTGGSGAPATNGGEPPKEGQPPNKASIWYEYGCV